MAGKHNTTQTSRESLLRSISGGRSSLLLILIFTVVNILFLLMDVDRYFLFSASVPYYLTMMGKGIDNGFVDGPWDIIDTYTITGLVLGAAILVLYLLCWLLSKKRFGWLTAAMVLFLLDTVALAVFTFTLYDNPMVNLVDFLLHIWAIVELSKASGAASLLKNLPAEEVPEPNDFSSFPSMDIDSENLL